MPGRLPQRPNEYKTLQNNLTKGSRVSPIDGTVTERNAEIGLKPSTEAAMFVVEDTNDLYVKTAV
jgi:hypothetical protein